MRIFTKWHLTVLLTAALQAYCAGTIQAATTGDKVSRRGHSKEGHVQLTAPINPDTKDWVKEELIQGRSVLLTNSYLFQVMKGRAQEDQKQTEEKLLIPLLKRTLQGLANGSTHPDTRRLFGVALLVLTDNPGVELGAEISSQADSVKQNTMFNPRSHYTDSEDLMRYFRAMQYLAKATVDVSIRPDQFPYPQEMLFPFETAVSVHNLFSDPANEALVRGWRTIHTFYSEVNGLPDYPTFVDLAGAAKDGKLTVEDVKTWAEARQLPKINPERGLGIQPLGERISLHQEVIDGIKEKFMKPDTPRKEIAQLLKFENLLKGVTRDGNSVNGLGERVASEKGDSYYVTTLRAVAWGARGWKRDRMRLNFFAASMTSLAEQTALMAKTSILVRKSAVVAKRIPDGVKLYLEPDSAPYLAALAAASGRMVRICRKTADETALESAKARKLDDMSPAFRVLGDMARKRQAVATGSPLWKTHGAALSVLARKSSVTVDVFHVKDRTGKFHYYQWAVALFEAAYPSAKSRAKLRGPEMVFFEAWSDEIAPGQEGPLNNLVWDGRILEGNLGVLPSIIKVPK